MSSTPDHRHDRGQGGQGTPETQHDSSFDGDEEAPMTTDGGDDSQVQRKLAFSSTPGKTDPSGMRTGESQQNQFQQKNCIGIDLDSIPRRKMYFVGTLVCLCFAAVCGVIAAVVSTTRKMNEAPSGGHPTFFQPSVSMPSVSMPKLPAPAPTASPVASPISSPTAPAPTASPVAAPVINPTASPVAAPVTSPVASPVAAPVATPLPTLRRTPAPTEAPVAPTLPPVAVDRTSEIATFVSTNSFITLEADPTTPNNRAFQFIARETRPLEFNDNLMQRFALVSLDYTMAGVGPGGTATQFSVIDSDECSWKGVVCNGTTVTELHFPRLGMTGSIPASISLLKDLTYIDFSDNNIGGAIPESLYDLTELKSLYLYKNQLNGKISNRIGNLFRLENLYLNENALTGPFPSTLRSGSEIHPIRKLTFLQSDTSCRPTTTFPNKTLLVLYSYDRVHKLLQESTYRYYSK